MGYLVMKKPRYVREYKDRHGKTRLEFRRKGHQGHPLRQPIRSPEFWEDYNAALRGEVPTGVLLRGGARPAAKGPTKAATAQHTTCGTKGGRGGNAAA